MSEPSKAVFLSYASQDADAARRICECLRSAGIEVWFDQSELRGGDVWDHTIRQQIHDCALFVPLISAHTDARTEGYFRLEWKLAVDRSYLMADDAAFLFPVVIDDTPDASARVPEKFRTVQWTRLPAGQTPPAFAQRIGALLAGTERPVSVRAAATMAQRGTQSALGTRGKAIAAVAVLALVGMALLGGRYLMRAPQSTLAKAASPAVVIPEHSIAVLPFINLSAGKNQEYFSDGLAEELLNVLSKVPGLQVAARTSAFSFKGHAVDVRTIGRQLLVAHVLEGSVRMVGNHLRVTAQLVRTDKGYQIWSETYDRELGDVFRIQDEISAAVVKALKVSLLGSAAPHSSGTPNTDAYLVFLQGRSKMASDRLADTQEAAQEFTRVLKLDPNFAPAYVELATAKLRFAEFYITESRQADFEAAKAEAKVLIDQALTLDPKNAQAYIERGNLRVYSDPLGAEGDFRRGIALNPNSARGYLALAALLYGDPKRLDEALAMLLRARQLDPLEHKYDLLRAKALFYQRSDLTTAGALLTDLVARDPQYAAAQLMLGELRMAEGRYADSTMYYEAGLKLEPLSDWARRGLILDYVSMGDPAAAEQVASEAPHRLPVNRLNILAYQGDWSQAAKVSAAAFADGTLLEIDWGRAGLALRMAVRQGYDYPRARAMLEKLCGVSWTGAVPTLPTQFDASPACVALGDLLITHGERAEGERLLRASIAAMDYNAHELKHGDFWYIYDRALALALLGDNRNSLATLRLAIRVGDQSTPWSLKSDPAFNALRSEEEFQGFVRTIDQRSELERQAMVRMRATGRLPDRGRTVSEPAVNSPKKP